MDAAALEARPAALYTGLLRRALSSFLYHGPNYPQLAAGRRPVDVGALLMDWRGDNFKATGAHTTGCAACLLLYERAMLRVLAGRVPGDVAEAGVYRGGASVLFQGILNFHGLTACRRVLLLDSFTGVPAPRSPHSADRRWTGQFAAPAAVPRSTFLRYGLPLTNVVTVPGLFNESLPRLALPRGLALIRFDADTYDSMHDVATALWPRLADGGIFITDDWLLRGSRDALLRYLQRHGVRDPVFTFHGRGRWEDKPKNAYIIKGLARSVPRDQWLARGCLVAAGCRIAFPRSNAAAGT